MEDKVASTMEAFREIESFEPLGALQAKALEYADGTRLDIKGKVERWYSNGRDRSWQRVMAFVGPAGCGKSVIMAYLGLEGGLVSRDYQKGFRKWFGPLKRLLRRNTGENTQKEVRISLRLPSMSESPNFTICAAHFFKHDDSNAASVRVCLLSVANQLAVAVPGVKEELLKLKEIESITDLKVLFRSLLCTPMMSVKTPEHPVVVLMDAIDEANPEEKEELVEILTTLWENETPQWLGVIISSRPEALVNSRFDNLYMLQLDSEENVDDVNTFLRQRLERYMKSRKDVEKALKLMANRCEGFFLFAGFVDKMLQERKERSLSLRDIKTLSEAFPSGLESMYRTYFTRFLQGPLRNNYEQYQAVFSSMVAARLPLDVEIIVAELTLTNENEIEDFLMQAGQLLVIKEGRMQFLHESMREFLQDRRRAGKVPEDETSLGGKHLSVSIDRGHKRLAIAMMDNPWSSFAREHLVYHLCKSKDWEGVKNRLLDFDWVHAAVSLPGVAKRLEDDTDRLYNYQTFSDIDATDVIRTIALGRNDIERDPDSLAFHLSGRIGDRSHPMLESLHASEFKKCAKRSLATSIYIPIQASLEPARSGLRKILEGHSDYVTAVAFGGDTVVSGSSDRTVRLWDRVTGECLQVFEGHSDRVVIVAVDGDTLVAVQSDWSRNILWVWDRRSGERRHLLKGHSDYVNAVAVDGDTVASCSCDTTVRLWDPMSGRCVKVLKGHSENVLAVAINGETVVSCSIDRTVRLWNRRSGRCLHVLNGHSNPASSVAIDGDIVVSGSRDAVRLWDREYGVCLNVLEGHFNGVPVVAIDGDTVMSGSWDYNVGLWAVRLWDRPSGECLHESYFKSDDSLACDGKFLASCKDNTVRLWDPSVPQSKRLLERPSSPVLAASTDGDTVVSCHKDDKTVWLWDRVSGKRRHLLEGHSSYVLVVAIDGDTVVSGSSDQTVRLWDQRSSECVQVLRGHTYAVNTVAIDGDTVVSGSLDATVRLWDRKSGECVQVLEGHCSWVNAVAIGGDTVVSGSADRTVRLWDLRSGECLQVLEGHSSHIGGVAIDGDIVVSGSWDKTARLWDRKSGECLLVLEGHSKGVSCVTIDGDTVVSGSEDKTVRLWDRRTGENVQGLESHSADGVNAVTVDGDTMTLGSGDATAHLASRVIATFEGKVTGLTLSNVNEGRCITVSESSSTVPHVLIPL